MKNQSHFPFLSTTLRISLLAIYFAFAAITGRAQSPTLGDLFTLTSGNTKAVNALWTENPVSVQFSSTNIVTVADRYCKNAHPQKI